MGKNSHADRDLIYTNILIHKTLVYLKDQYQKQGGLKIDLLIIMLMYNAKLAGKYMSFISDGLMGVSSL